MISVARMLAKYLDELMMIWLAHNWTEKAVLFCFIDGTLIYILNVYKYLIILMITRMMRQMESFVCYDGFVACSATL